MGAVFSQEHEVEQLFQFRRLSTDTPEFEIPEKPKNRSPTNKPWIYVFILAFVILIPFLIYTLSYTELRQLSGTDDCGNFCGYKNKKYEEWACTGKDYTAQKYQLITKRRFFEHMHVYVERTNECVSSCPNDTEPIFHACVHIGADNSDKSEKEFMFTLGDIGKEIAQNWWAILLSTIVSCLLSLGVLLLFRFAVDFVVWFILIGSIGILTIFAGLCWYAFLDSTNNIQNTNNESSNGSLSLAITLSIVVIILVIVLTCMVRRVKLLIALFKESTKAIFDIPSLILLPIYVSVLLTLTFLGFILLNFFMVFAGRPKEIAPGNYAYRMDNIMIATVIYNTVTFAWLVEFIFGSQYIVMAGAVSSWFFTRNKHQLDAPVWTSFTNFIRFHLGTVALGSLILAIVNVARRTIMVLSRNPRIRALIRCCMSTTENLIRFLNKNAYIQTAMHGQPFYKSSKRAAKLLLSNAVNVIAVNSIGDFVLTLATIILVLVSSGAGILIAMATGAKHYWAIAVVCGFIATIMALTFVYILKITIDCILICFCEDMTLNDGMARPYFMSKGLMKFIEDSKAIMPKKE